MNRYIFLIYKLTLLLLTLLFFVNGEALAEYSIERVDPIGKDLGINANFGQFRARYGTYKSHDGIDYRTRDGRGNTLQNIYPVSSGTAYPHFVDDSGWGRYVIVDHGGYQTRYAHLNSISVSDGQWVTTTTTLGVSGQTNGRRNSDMGPHLHFGLGAPNVLVSNTINPIVAGLKQGEYGSLLFVENKVENHKICLLGTGSDGTFDGNNDRLQIVQPGQPARAIIEAYHKSNDQYFNPYKVEFEIENLTNNSWGSGGRVTKTIEFDTMSHILSNFDDSENGVYCFSRPFVTYVSKEADYADYYFIKFYPTGGVYRITAKIYSCYRDDFGFHLSEPEEVSRTITIGLQGLDYNATGYSYAWLPDDISDHGVMLASVPTSVGAAGVVASGVAESSPPEIFYAFANNNRITSNLLDVSPNFQKNAVIEARATPEADWIVQFFNSSGTEVDRRTIDDQSWLGVEWGQGKPSGTYSFKVTAINRAGVTTYEAYDRIVVDNTKPSAVVAAIKNSVGTTGEAIETSIRSAEDLYSLVVNVVDDHYSIVQDQIFAAPSLDEGEILNVNWNNASSFPDGAYYLQYVMTDLAGNISKAYSPGVFVNKSGIFIPPPTGEVKVIDEPLPELPPWSERPWVSDLAFDSSGNKYVLYGMNERLVKYSPDGTEIASIEGFRLPLGLTVSSSGDRIYVSDTYANRLVIYDGGLNLIKEIKGKDIYLTYGDVDSYEWVLGWKTADVAGDAGGGDKKDSYERYNLPTGVALSSAQLYVVDKDKHRLLKYTKDGDPQIFSILKADLSDEARNAFNQDYTVNGQTVEKALFYSSALNDKIVFDSNSIGHLSIYEDSWKKHWTKVMFNHNNPSGNSNGQFSFPQSVAVDSAGSVYVADAGNDCIQIFYPDGSFDYKLGKGILSAPGGLDVDLARNVWVADTGHHRIVQFDRKGTFVKEYKTEDYELVPLRLKIKNGNLYIADAKHSQPLTWNIAGKISELKIPESWFSPNADESKDNLKISYSISEPANISVNVFSSTAESVSIMASNANPVINNVSRSAGGHEEIWDGFLSNATVVASGVDTTPESQTIADGHYTLKLSAAFGDYIKTKTADIHVDTAAPSIEVIRDPPAISPNSDGQNDSLLMNYSISDNLSPTVEVKLLLKQNSTLRKVFKNDPSPCSLTPSTFSLSWDGKISGVVQEGSYTLELSATDLAGNTATTSESVTVDIHPPQIENLTVSEAYFSPNGDGKKDNTTIIFDLKDNYADTMFVTVQINDSANALIAKLLDRVTLDAGTQTITWEGEGIADGLYKIRIYAEDEAANLGNADTDWIVVDTIPPEIDSLVADPNPFTPNNDGVNDKTTFSYILSELCNTELRILKDDNTTIFRTHIGYKVSEESFSWNGDGFRGEILGQEHPYSLLAEDLAGNVTTSETKVIEVAYAPSLVPYAYAVPDPFAPVNPSNDETQIKYYLTQDNLTINLAITGKEGRVVKQLINNQVENKGDHEVAWDGSFDPSYDGPKYLGKATDGSWEFKLSADANDGSNPAVVTNTVLVDNMPPTILAKPVEVDLTVQKASLEYSIPETVSLEVGVFDLEDRLLAQLEATEKKTPGVYTALWQPAEAPSGQQYFKVTAVDSAKNQDEVRSDAFAVVAQIDPMISLAAVIPATFTPNNDGLSDLIRFSYQISGGSPDYLVDINIENTTGTTIKELVRSENQSAGRYSYYWDGKNTSGSFVADGEYNFVVRGVDERGREIEYSQPFVAVSSRPITTLILNKAIFSPNGDGSQDSVGFTYSFDYPQEYITGEGIVRIEVLNSSNEAVLEETVSRTPGTYTYEWSPSSDNLPSGTYYVKLKAENALGTDAAIQTKSLIIDYVKPVVTIVELAPNPFSPDPNGIKDETALAYRVSKNSAVTILVKNSAGATVKQLLDSASVSASSVRIMTIPTVGWDGKNSSDEFVPDGIYEINVMALDPAGNTGEAVTKVTVDNDTVYDSEFAPIRNLDIRPAYAKEGSVVTIDFSVAEELVGQPSVHVGSFAAEYLSNEKISDSRYDYHYSHTITADDLEGLTAIGIETIDLAGNVSSLEGSIVIDQTSPEASNLVFDPVLAKAGEISLSFDVSETLEADPIILITQNGAVSQAAYSVQKTETGYQAKYEVAAGFDGTAEVQIVTEDLAGNISTNIFENSLQVDTTDPVFTNLNCEITANPDFSKFAMQGAGVELRFNTSEELLHLPTVTVNGNSCDYQSLIDNEYTYSYTVSDSDIEGTAEVRTIGIDLAGNDGEYSSTLTNESFIIDLTRPTVTVSDDPSIIANPGVFTTNGSADLGSCQTRLTYEISEPGYVTVSIHNVEGVAKPYTREAFTASNRVHVYDEGWSGQGVNEKVWNAIVSENKASYDLDNNNLADPGLYAFIVEVRDRAGNLIEGKWGGTCTVQDNVLRQVIPDQTETEGQNPRPNWFSPNGDGTFEATTVYFRVILATRPNEPQTPEPIRIASLPETLWNTTEVKSIGYYTVRVYDSGHTLIRTITENQPLLSNTLTSEDWNGRSEAGTVVADGVYSIEIDTRDFLGQESLDNLRTYTVTVDNTVPLIINHEVSTESGNPWLNANRGTYNVDFTDNQANASQLKDLQYRIGVTGTWEYFARDVNAASYTDDWGSELFDLCSEGVNPIYARATDRAQNMNIPQLVFYVRKDANPPPSPTASTSYSTTNEARPTWNWTTPSDTSGIAGYYIKVGTSDGASNIFPEIFIGLVNSWSPSSNLSDGTYYAQVRARDNAGNIGSWSGGVSVRIDTSAPTISGISDSPDPISPGNIDDNRDSITFNYTIDETATVSIYVDGTRIYYESKSRGSYSYEWTGCSALTEGTRNYYIRAVDGAGNSRDSATYSFIVDNTPPAAPSNLSATSANGVANLAWDAVGGVDGYNVYRSSAYNGLYDKVNSSLVIETSYQNTGLTNGMKYWYKVAAVDSAGNEGITSYVLVNPGSLNTARIYFWAFDPPIRRYKMNADGSSCSEVSIPPTSGKFSFSNNGQKIVYLRVSPVRPQVYIANRDGSGATRLSYSGITEDYPAFSPDDSEIIFQRGGSIYTMNSDGSRQTKLTDGSAPFYSPDGLAVVYRSGYDIYLISSSGGSSQQLTDLGDCWEPSFSPDGTKIIFGRSNNGIWRINKDGTNLTQLSYSNNYSSGYSPDGTKIVYYQRGGIGGSASYDEDIFIMDADGGNKINLTNDAEKDDYDPVWTPFISDMSAFSVEDKTSGAQVLSGCPILVAPVDNGSVNSIRPTFQWQHHEGSATEYNVDIAKNDSFTISHQQFTKSANTGSPDDKDSTLFNYTYAIHEFDPGLDRDTYYWKVTALSTNEAATSESWSFTVAPSLTLIGVTNYPNPFDPNRETTSIRYRLGADAEDVTIRIYDITGALVKELVHCSSDGEGSSVWQKYNDVDWDGKNGRGDKVVNGIYPFEVIAKNSGQTISARGKIAVLK